MVAVLSPRRSSRARPQPVAPPATAFRLALPWLLVSLAMTMLALIGQVPGWTLLVFGLAPPQASQDLPPFVPSAETSEMTVAQGPLELAFSTHTEVMARYWKEMDNDGNDVG